jgi:hypothetical protein
MFYTLLFFLFGVYGYAVEPSGEAFLRHTEGKGLGYSEGYTSFDLFLTPLGLEQPLVPFADIRGHIFNNGKQVLNAGGGVRWMDPCQDIVWGANGYYDFYQSPHRNYHQFSLGLEALGTKWEGRVNGYFPLHRAKTSLYQFTYRDLIGKFRVVGRMEVAMKGIDAELGYRFCSGYDIYVGFAPYYYWGRSAKTTNAFRHKDIHALGGRFRAKGRLCDMIDIEGVTSYDTRFNWAGQVTVGLSIPLGRSFCEERDRMRERVIRNEIIVTDRISRHSTNPLILDPEHKP